MAELLSTLEKEGFSFGLEEHLRWHELLGRLPDDIAPEQLKTIVCPLLATDEAEQVLVYQLFDESLERVKVINESIEDGSKKRWKFPIPLGWIIFWLAILGAFSFALFSPVEKRQAPRLIPPTYATVAPGQQKRICVEEKKLADKPRMIGAQLVNRAKTESTVGSFSFKKPCLNYAAKNAKGADTIAVEFMDLDENRWYTTFYIFVDEIQLDTIEKPIAQKRINQNKSLFFYKKFPFEKDIRSLETPPLTPIEEFYQKYAKWIKLFLGLAVLGVLAKILLDREEKRKKMVAAMGAQKDIFPLWKLAPGLVEDTVAGQLFFNLLNKLRKRTPDDFYKLNIPKTVDRTIKKAGMVSFQYDVQTRPPEYILLVDGASPSNHLSKLFELLVEHFKANEVYLERFFIHPKNGLFYNEVFPNGLSLAAMQERFYNSKLLLLAAAYEPKSEFLIKLDHWKNTFDAWSEAALLLPVPILAEASQDHSLKEVFSLVPATMSGIDYLIEQQTIGSRKGTKALLHTHQLSSELAKVTENYIPFLKKYISEPLLIWIASCAIYPSLHWSLTTHLGKVLSDEEDGLLSLENLFSLTALPWFINGKIPDKARTELLEYLYRNKPGLYEKLNGAIAQILQKETLFNKGQIGQEPIVGVDKNLIDKQDTEELSAKVESFSTAMPSRVTEIPIITKLDRKEGLLDFLIPKKWKQNLRQLGFPNLGQQEFWRDVLTWALPILLLTWGLLWMLPEKWDNCDGELFDYVYKEQLISLCISKPEDRLLLNEYLARDAIAAQQERKVDSLTTAVNEELQAVVPNGVPLLGSPLDTARNSFFANVSVEYFNRGVQFYNNFLQSNAAVEKEGSVNTLKTEACYHFTRAIEFDSLDIDMQNAVAWCLEKKEPKTRALQGKVVDAANQLALANAKVSYQSQVTVTDSLGQFNFNVPESTDTQSVVLIINKIGYLEKEEPYPLVLQDSSLLINTPILLEIDPATISTYTVKGTITDKETKQAPIVPINIFREQELETISKGGSFMMEITENLVINNTIKIRLEGQGYQPIIQEIVFDENKTITLDMDLEPVLSDNFETIASADEIDLLDSLDYLLNRVLELSEAPTPINFDIPKPQMKFIEGSTYAMGDIMGDNKNEKSGETELPHVVTLSSFYIGLYEVTFEEFDLYCELTGKGLIGDAGWGRGRRPAFQVSWYDAIEYCNWLSEQLGYDPVYTIDKNRQDPNNKSRLDRQKWTVEADWTANGYRLPTEAEWEYAGRQGGEKVRYSNGKDIAIPKEINYAAEPDSRIEFVKSGENRRQTVEVGSLPANAQGLHEMSGNVPEWVWDWLGDYPNYAQTNPTGVETGTARILRGGSFGFSGELAKSFARYSSDPTRVNGLGFRLCRGAK